MASFISLTYIYPSHSYIQLYVSYILMLLNDQSITETKLDYRRLLFSSLYFPDRKRNPIFDIPFSISQISSIKSDFLVFCFNFCQIDIHSFLLSLSHIDLDKLLRFQSLTVVALFLRLKNNICVVIVFLCWLHLCHVL